MTSFAKKILQLATGTKPFGETRIFAIVGAYLWIVVGAINFSQISVAQTARPLIIYSPHGPEILKAAKDHFRKKYPQVEISWEYLGAEDIAKKVLEEARPGSGKSPKGDIWWGGPQFSFIQAANAGALQPYKPTWHDAVNPELRDKNDLWHADMQTPLSIVYNKQLKKDLGQISDWDDLLKERYKGKLVLRFPVDSGTMRAIIGALIQRKIKETGSEEKAFQWLKSLEKQTGKYVDHSQKVFQTIGQGLHPISLWNVAEIKMRRGQGFPVEFVFPKSGMPILTDGIALIKNPERHPHAIDFFELVTGLDFVRVLAQPPFSRIPTRNDVDKKLKPTYLTDPRFKPMEVDWQQVAQNISSWLAKWELEIADKAKRP